MTALLTIKDAANRLTCSDALVEKWIREGRLPIVKVGRLTRIRPEDLDTVVQQLQPTTRRAHSE